jgi:hypothetical protein
MLNGLMTMMWMYQFQSLLQSDTEAETEINTEAGRRAKVAGCQREPKGLRRGREIERGDRISFKKINFFGGHGIEIGGVGGCLRLRSFCSMSKEQKKKSKH